MERAVLRSVCAFGGRGIPAQRTEVARQLFGPEASKWTRGEWRERLVSFHRAVRSLKGKGLVRELKGDFILEMTEAGAKELEKWNALGVNRGRPEVPDLDGSGSKSAEIDLEETVRHRPGTQRRRTVGRIPAAGIRTGRG